MVHRNCASSLKGRTDQQLLATKAKHRGLLGLSTLQLTPCISALAPRPVAAHTQQRSCSHHPHTAACPGMAAQWLCIGVCVGLGQAGECTQAAGCSWGAGESCCLWAPAGQPAQPLPLQHGERDTWGRAGSACLQCPVGLRKGSAHILLFCSAVSHFTWASPSKT